MATILVKKNVPLAPLTTFQVGGRARFFVSVSGVKGLIRAIGAARERGLPYCLLAGGSNVVFGDKTYPGLVIHYAPRSKVCQVENTNLLCEANLPLARLIKEAIKHNLGGLEALSGIPGTVGGAVVGNAGAYGQCISDHLFRVEIYDGERVRWLGKEACRFSYRDSIFKRRDWLVLRVEFGLAKSRGAKLLEKSQAIVKIRNQKYRPGLRCPGSFFKNVLVRELSKKALAKIDESKIIEGKLPAGYLLEAVGARGLKCGGLTVADYHGNLLINTGQASCRDVKRLAAKLKKLVRDQFGIALEEEIRYLT